CVLAFVAGCAQTGKGGSGGGLTGPSAAEVVGDIAPPAGWQANESPKVFIGRKLCDHIDGDAERYLTSGFRSAAVCAWSPGADNTAFGSEDSLIVEVYEMEGPRAAFAIHSQNRSSSLKTAALGDDCCYGPGCLDFYRGKYVARVMIERSVGGGGKAAASSGAAADTEHSDEALVMETGKRLAEVLDRVYGVREPSVYGSEAGSGEGEDMVCVNEERRLLEEELPISRPTGARLPALAHVLPSTWKVAGSEKYYLGIANCTLGAEEMVEAKYDIGGGLVSVALLRFDSACEAESAMESLLVGYADAGWAAVQRLASGEGRAFWAFDRGRPSAEPELALTDGSTVQGTAVPLNSMCFLQGPHVGIAILVGTLPNDAIPRAALLADWLRAAVE
ncbi:MAG: hypothetical protein RDV41_14085, partial [Planctomycetota bacterium]|nr:hypothetical protein [Planctomycetota bacterium]